MNIIETMATARVERLNPDDRQHHRLTFKPDFCFEPCNVPFWGFQKSVPKWSQINMKHDGPIYCSMFPVVFRHCWSKLFYKPLLVFFFQSLLWVVVSQFHKRLYVNPTNGMMIPADHPIFHGVNHQKSSPFRGSRPDSQCRRHRKLLRTSGAEGLKLDSFDVQILQRRMS